MAEDIEGHGTAPRAFQPEVDHSDTNYFIPTPSDRFLIGEDGKPQFPPLPEQHENSEQLQDSTPQKTYPDPTRIPEDIVNEVKKAIQKEMQEEQPEDPYHDPFHKKGDYPGEPSRERLLKKLIALGYLNPEFIVISRKVQDEELCLNVQEMRYLKRLSKNQTHRILLAERKKKNLKIFDYRLKSMVEKKK